jgi:hypothetical protein
MTFVGSFTCVESCGTDFVYKNTSLNTVHCIKTTDAEYTAGTADTGVYRFENLAGQRE